MLCNGAMLCLKGYTTFLLGKSEKIGVTDPSFVICVSL
jgi:hypothetical protein